ncbi:MAG: PAS domain S-box protein [Myxococcales bacterium]|nr:MAG: PAS domain S-box protein [Myxococcales bacterium]
MADLDLRISGAIDHLSHLQSLFERLEMGAMVVDSNFRICWVNKQIRHIDYCLQSLDDITPEHPRAIDRTLCGGCPVARACLAPRDRLFFSEQFTDRHSQTRRTFSIIIQHLSNEAEKPGPFIVFVRDISSREAAFREKQELQTLLANVLDNTVDAVITLDLKSEIHSWNRGAWQAFGYDKKEVRGKHISMLFPADGAAAQSFDEIHRLVEEKGFVHNHRARMFTKDKRVIDVAVTQTVMNNSAGEPFGHSLIIRDISKVVHLEQLLSHKVIQLTKLLQMDDIIRSAKTLEEITDVILVAVTAGEGLRFNRSFLLLVNPIAQNLAGVEAVGPSSPEEAHRIYSQHFFEHPTLAEIIHQRQILGAQADLFVNEMVRRIEIPLSERSHPLIRCLMENRPYLYMRGGAEDGVLQPVLSHIHSDEFVAVPLVWQDQHIGIIIADNSVTRREITMEDIQFLSSFASRAASGIASIQLQEDLRIKVEELKNSYKELSRMQETSLRHERLAALGEMAGKVAHEVRNPLSAIGGFARLVLRTSPSEENKKYLGIIADEAKRLEDILGEVLGYVKMASEEFLPQDLNALVDECRMIVERQNPDKRFRILTQFDPELPLLACNANRLKQAFINILQNAVDAMGRNGQVTIRTRRDSGVALVEFTDTGVGIAQENMAHLFEAFFTTKPRGVGLGLNITKKIIEQHKGQISAKSRLGEGTTFEIRIPMDLKEGNHAGYPQKEASYR